MVFGLTILLGIGLPAVLILVSQVARPVSINVPFVAVVIFLGATGLYVSSASGSGVKALLISGPAALSLFPMVRLLGDIVFSLGWLVGYTPVGDPFGPWVLALIGAIVFMFLVGFGLRNHRSSDRSSVRIWRQLLWLSGSVAAVMLIAVMVR